MISVTKKILKWFFISLLLTVSIFAVIVLYEKNTQDTIDFAGISYTDCWTDALGKANAICGLMSVPISYNNEKSDARAFSFAILPALENSPQAIERPKEPIVFLIGGPGPAGTYHANIFLESGSGAFLRNGRELILVDYRGSGMSVPYAGCEIPSGVVSALRCLKAILVSDSDEFRSANFAKDVNNLIKMLGHDAVVLYGASYGTRLALTMMRDTPEYISHVVLDGVFPIEVNGFTQGPRSLLAGLALIAKRCEKDPLCHQKLGLIIPKLEALAVKWGQREDKDVLFSFLAQYSHFPQAPLLVDKLSGLTADEAADLLLKIASLDVPGGPEQDDNERSLSIPLALGVVCSEEAAFMKEQPLDSERHGFSPGFVYMLSNISSGAPFSASQAGVICGVLGVDDAPEIEQEPVESDIPTLLTSGGMDLQTSFEWGILTSENLSNSQHHIVPYSDHMVMFDEEDCGRNLISQFIADPENELDLSCLREYPIEPLLVESDNILDDFKNSLSSTSDL